MFSFQTLPYLIIDNIIVWHCRSTKHKWEALSPALWVCQSWRSVVLPYLLNEYEVGPEKTRLGLWPPGLPRPVPEIASWVKRLQIYLPLPIDRPYVGDDIPVFSNAWSLAVNTRLNSYEFLKQIRDCTTFEALVQPIQHIAPNARDLIINLGYSWQNSTNNQAKEPLGILKLSITLGVSGLTRLILGRGALPIGFTLIGMFAKTLQILAITELDMSISFAGLVVDSDTGEHKVYPNMRHLIIDFADPYQDRIENLPINPGVASFPNLKRLECPSGYPFGDDMLFRGNQHSLESINLLLDKDTAKMLDDYRVFSKDTHPNLCSVVMELKSNAALSTIYKMARHAQVFRMYVSPYRASLLANFISDVSKLKPLRILSLHASILTLEQVYKLAKALPNLEKLTCKNLTGYGDGAPQNNINTSPSNNHSLKVLRLMNDDSDPTSDIVGSAMRLTSVCPSIYMVKIRNGRQLAEFKDRWNYLLFVGDFKEHALRLFSIKIFACE